MQDERFANNALRLKHRKELTSILEAVTRTYAKADILALCADESVPGGSINTLDEVFADPQVRARGMQLDLAEGIKGLRTPIKFNGQPCSAAEPSPILGQHNHSKQHK